LTITVLTRSPGVDIAFTLPPLVTRIELKDGTVLMVQERAADLEALVARRAPGQVGLTTAAGQVLVTVADIARVG
jgi:hypothetical protein